MSVKITISYQTPEELQMVLDMLNSRVIRLKRTKPKEGHVEAYKKAYAFLDMKNGMKNEMHK